jgi:calcium-binding protein CML
MSDLATLEGLKTHVVHALQLAKKELDEKNQKANFVRIIMRFPQIKAVFDRLRAIHAKCDVDGNGTIDKDELIQAMAELFNEGKGKEPVRASVVASTLSLSEIDHEEKDGNLSVKEFIVMCAIGFILSEEDENLSTFGGMLASNDDEYRRAMTDVVTAYLSFDREAKGYFTSEDVQGLIKESKRGDAAMNLLTEERYAELDVSGDGRIDFEEFVYAFSNWVSSEDDDEYYDDDTAIRAANPLNKRILLALQLSKSILEKNKKDANFTRILVRFPKIHKVFDRIKSVHAAYDLNKNGRLDLAELKSAMNELVHDGSTDDMDGEQVDNMFMLSDIDHNHEGMKAGLDVKEFIVFCAVGFILAEAAKKSTLGGVISEADKEYRAAMMDIVAAYLTFDPQGKGYFTAEEMHAATSSVSKGKDAATLLTPARWAELDHDNSGRVDFEEFVYGFSCWVTAGDDEDYDEE